MHPLDGTRLKIIRAKEQLESFYREIDLFWESVPKPCEVIPESDSKKPPYVFRFKVNRHPPPENGV